MNEATNNTGYRDFLMANIFHSFVERTNNYGVSYTNNTMEKLTRVFTKYADAILELHAEFKDKMDESGIRLMEDVVCPLGDLLALDTIDSADPVSIIAMYKPREAILEAVRTELDADTFCEVFKGNSKHSPK